jgi:hypothetical protein
MNIEEYVERAKSGNVQTKKSKVEENVEHIMKFFAKITHSKKKVGRP